MAYIERETAVDEVGMERIHVGPEGGKVDGRNFQICADIMEFDGLSLLVVGII